MVAALKIPNLAHKIQNRILETQFKNSTAKLNQAIRRAKYELDVDTLDAYCTAYNDSYYTNARECFSAILNAYNSRGTKKRSNYITYDIDRTNKIYNFNKTSEIPFIDTAMQHVLYQNRMLDSTYIGLNVVAFTTRFSIDINGDKGPNKLGYDIFMFQLNSNDDSLKGYKWNGTNYTQEDLDELKYSYSANYFKATAGSPCSKTSPQQLNGIGCGWYALHDICPFDGKPGYFRCLP